MAEALGMLQDRDQMSQVTQPRHNNMRSRQTVHCAAIVALLGSIVVLIVGIVLIVISFKSNNNTNHYSYNPCGLSSETEGARLKEFLTKIKRKYFELHRNKIYHDSTTRGFRAMNYRAYNPKPSFLKTITDTSVALQEELSNLDLDFNKLTTRESKAVSQAQHYLRHTFGQPYGVNYYAGDWMMGPNQFCLNPICEIKFDIYNYLQHFKPRNLKEVNKLREVLRQQADGIAQYILNLKSGVKVGMVRSIEECQAGIDAIKQNFLNISLHQERGVVLSKFVSPAFRSDFTSKISYQHQNTWRKETSETVKQSIRRYIVEFVGKPIIRLIRYLENDHIRHCVPSSVSSGLASLPLDDVYLDQVKSDVRTSKMLPSGEHLNGSKSYEMIMSYFTTNSLTPKEVDKIGHKQLEIIYPQVLEIARQITKISNDSKAVEKFREILNSRKYQFSREPFPENESNAEAYKRCSTIKLAKQFCPKRWNATENYWYEARMVMNLLASKIVPMFYFSDEKITVPVCPVQMTPHFNPSIGVEGYRASDVSCSQSAFYYTPFFLDNFRPRYEVWTTAAHETIPGHHTQLQGRVEHFREDCKDIASWLDQQTSHKGFSEGWAVYAENPLISETDIYDNNLMQKYGMLKAQIWRVLRLIIDTGLHYKGLKRNESLALLDNYAWDNSDAARKEVTRYQSVFGQATGYMIGRLRIMELRDYTRDKLGEQFSHKEFHYQVLSQGNAPLEFLTLHIHKYVDCELHHSEDTSCDVIKTRPIKKTGNENKVEMGASQEPSAINFNQLRYF